VTGKRNGKGEWCVEANGKRAWLSEKDLILLGREEKGREAQTGVTIERAERAPMDFGGGAGIELKLLGNRAEEAVQRVERHLDEAALSGLPFVRIIHGIGTGALKRAVAEVLEGHPLVKNFAPAEPEGGGDGVTVVEMAGERTVSMP
jgi:DNA mismatch repair protein MutS2